MIRWISNWAGGIIIAVIIGTIIEMILPEGNSKKYIKVVIGVYILFTIISPVITKFTGKSIAVSDILELEQYINTVKEKEIAQNLLESQNSSSIKDIYIGNLKADIQNKLKLRGYIVTNINLEIEDNENYTLNKIYLKISKQDNEDNEDSEAENINYTNKIEMVNEINIDISNSDMLSNDTENVETIKDTVSNYEKNKIKEYLSSVYEINEKNIIIN